MLSFNWIVNSSEIPSYVTLENETNVSWNAISAMYIFLPVAGFAIFWGRKDIFSRLLLQLDRSCLSVFCPSFSKREKLIRWFSGRLPATWSSQLKTLNGGVADLWTDGSLLCTLINSAVPGACPNPHRHWKKPPIHAQNVAYKYLGLEAKFTEKDLSGKFTMNQERKFIQYLCDIQQAITKLQSQKDMSEMKFSSKYLVRGMGLYTGERYKKTVFYIYPNTRSKHQDTICVSIRGPYGTTGKNVLVYPVMPNVKVSNTSDTQFKDTKQQSFFKAFPIDLSSILTKDSKNLADDISITLEVESDRIKVTYIPKDFGMYELNITSGDETIRGCPYNIHVVDSEKENDSENVAPLKTFKRIVLKQNMKSNFRNIFSIREKLKVSFLKEREEYIRFDKKSDDSVKENEEKIDDDKTDKNENSTIISDSDIENNNSSLETVPCDDLQEQAIETKVKIQNINKYFKSLNISTLNEDSFTNIPNEENLPLPVETNTSPICPNHIVPEVTSQELSLTDKRKLFKKQSLIEETFENSSFSDCENDDVSKDMHQQDCSSTESDSLGMINYNFPLTTAVSLPNINSMEEYKNIFNKKKAFWENLSSSRSSSVSNLSSGKCVTIKSNNLNTKENNLGKNYNVLIKSVDNFLSSSEIIPFQELKSYKSVDNSLDYCTIFSIEERKQILLKDNYEKEKFKNNSRKNSDIKITDFVKNNNIEFIEKNDCSLNSQTNVKDEKPSINLQSNNNFIYNDLQMPKTDTSKLKMHFKKTIHYFKNLEKSISKPQKLTSEEYETSPKSNKRKFSGSLNFSGRISKLSEMFSKTDVDAIATYSRLEAVNFEQTIDDSICKSKVKFRHRKSLKSIFDVTY